MLISITTSSIIMVILVENKYFKWFLALRHIQDQYVLHIIREQNKLRKTRLLRLKLKFIIIYIYCTRFSIKICVLHTNSA